MRVALITLLLIIAWTGKAHALSCAPQVLNKEAIEGHAIIFEGVAEKVRSTSFIHWIKRDNLKLYSFRVTRHWYGENTEDTVDILAAPGWAQNEAYTIGKSYMVFGKVDSFLKGKLGVYSSSPGWCGFDLYPIEESRIILEQYHVELGK